MLGLAGLGDRAGLIPPASAHAPISLACLPYPLALPHAGRLAGWQNTGWLVGWQAGRLGPCSLHPLQMELEMEASIPDSLPVVATLLGGRRDRKLLLVDLTLQSFSASSTSFFLFLQLQLRAFHCPRLFSYCLSNGYGYSFTHLRP